MLDIRQLNVGYGRKKILTELSLQVQPGEIVALIGPNGCGKSTLLSSISGLLPPWSGEVWLEGVLLNRRSPGQTIAQGLVLAPQGSRIFDQLTVLENLEVAGYSLSAARSRQRIERVMMLFPILQQRATVRADSLSGGQQQLLAIARALIPEPKMLLLDEPSLGLAPNLLQTVFDTIVQINQKTGVSVLIVEQRVREVLAICHRVYAIKQGTVAFSGTPNQLQGDRLILQNLFFNHR